MFLKNYTSDVPVHQTMHRIEQVLIRCGVSGIAKEYGPAGVVTAVSFQIKFTDGSQPWQIRLPVNVESALDALWLNYANGDKLSGEGDKQCIAWGGNKKKRRGDFREQAERTAWKITQDWVEVQMSMIQMRQADFREVFLPYVWDGRRTFFTALKESSFKGLLPQTTE